MKIEPDWINSPTSNAVMAALVQAGKQAYFVGGCVRNYLLNAPVADLDIATDALPTETQRIMKNAGIRTIQTGIDHGTITAISHGETFEITTFRRDIETDGRRAVVAFSTDIIEDARRRDFTMNALYVDRDGQLTDPLNGLPDLRARRVRFIEDADQRIAEDFLRILRFFRFHAWYGDPAAGLDADGLAACAAGAEGIDTLSKERIGAEMRKLLAANNPAPAVASMGHCGALMRILPGASPTALAPLVHLEAEMEVRPNWLRRLAVIGGENPMQNLRLSKAENRRLETIYLLISTNCPPIEAGYRHGIDIARDSILVLAASLSAAVPKGSFSQINRGAEAVFPVKAADLQNSFHGKELGKKLKELERRWISSDMRMGLSELLD